MVYMLKITRTQQYKHGEEIFFRVLNICVSGFSDHAGSIIHVLT